MRLSSFYVHSNYILYILSLDVIEEISSSSSRVFQLWNRIQIIYLSVLFFFGKRVRPQREMQSGVSDKKTHLRREIIV